MLGKIISIAVGLVIVYFTVRVLLKSFKDAKEGKCTGCSGDCSSCNIGLKDKGNAAEL